MSRSMGLTIADSLALSLGYGERLLAGIDESHFARLATPGGQTVNSNHPAFIYGHLSLYAPRILNDLGKTAPEIPAGFQDACSKDASCVDDPDGTIYPSMKIVTEFFFKAYRAAAEAIQETPDEVFQQPNPLGGRMTELFPTLGSMHNFYVGGHVMIHMGQLSAWRRMQGLGPA